VLARLISSQIVLVIVTLAGRRLGVKQALSTAVLSHNDDQPVSAFSASELWQDLHVLSQSAFRSSVDSGSVLIVVFIF
jgi:hypothetical protein